MFCASCNVPMNDSTTKLKVPGKENTVEVTNIPCSVCPTCNTKVIDSVTIALVHKTGKKIRDATLDFEKIHGISIIAGKI